MKYSYIIYKIYSWTAHKKGETPIGNTILTLAVVHFFQFFTLLMIVDRLIIPLPFLPNINKTYIYIGAPIYFISFYFIIYNKERWNRYIDKYSKETEKQRKRGNFWVISYLVGSILIFLISLPILFSLGQN